MGKRHVVWVNEPTELVGGCEQYLVNSVRLLRDDGYRSTLLYDGARTSANPILLQAFDASYPMVDIPLQIRELAPELIYLHGISRRGDVQTCIDTGVPVARFFHDHALFCLRRYKYKTLSHQTCTKPIGARCYPCLGFINKSDRFPGIKLSRLGALRKEQQIHKGLAAIAVGSRYMADHVAAHGFEARKIHVLPLYALPPVETAPVEREPELLLFVGQLLRGKGIDILLKSLARTTHKPRLVLLGAGRQETMFRKQSEALGLGSLVDFAGKVDRKRLAEWYQRATCVVFPSREPETFGLVGPEAMSYGTPVIATAVGGTGEWMVHGKTGFHVPPDDSQALAAAIDRMLDDSEGAARMGQAAKEHYEARFRPEHHIVLLKRFFDAVITGGNA